MAVSLNDIKNKIASTKNTSQITNAMQMVSAAKLGKSEEAAKNFQIYASKVRKLLTDLLHGHEAENAKHHPMLTSRPVKKTGYIVITSDRGLVGGYNATILKAMMELKAEYHQREMILRFSVLEVLVRTFVELEGFSQFMNCVVYPINQALMRFVRLLAKPSRCIKMNFLMSSMSVTTIMSIV